MKIKELDRTEQIAVAGALVLIVLIYLPVIKDLITTWATDDNYSHGFLIPFVAGYFIWRKRRDLAAVEIVGSRAGLLVLLTGLALFIVGNAGAEYFTVGVSLVITLAGLVYFLLGREVMRQTWFAFFLLLFMIPVPAVLYFSATFPMQLFASKVTVALLKILGIPVLRQGNIIHLPEHSLEVAEACSGLRSLVSLLAMGAVYGYLTQERFISKSLLFLSTVPIAVFGNVVRVFVTAMLAYLFDVDSTLEPAHSILGSMVFLVSFFVLVIIGAVLRRWFR